MFENLDDVVEGSILPLLEEAKNRSASGKRHVIMNARGGIPFDLLSIALLHLPVWSVNTQGRASALKWYIQLSSVMPWYKELYSRLDGWTVVNEDSDTFIVRHTVTGYQAVFSDEESIIWSLSKHQPPPFLIRVISPCPNSRADGIRDMLRDTEDVAKHVLTIWIRAPAHGGEFLNKIEYGDEESGAESKAGIYKGLVDNSLLRPHGGMGDLAQLFGMINGTAAHKDLYSDSSDECSDEDKISSSSQEMHNPRNASSKCKFFGTRRGCRNGAGCRFSHDF
eukprot:Plantae.Rhodophyta-Palmaria_palmata.ctg6482.p1 GENE.Plantae.Rhodophyta-Palmaria_palmata.ctg6482~~Plantae.Rhodophyta-Palmaria_palmata.ctg6482.p1  ORF type:complete len:280 (-),score=21.55 Plantae.Rhodophyta-Palmaria_palmata.ctg6482:879-1718(-)